MTIDNSRDQLFQRTFIDGDRRDLFLQIGGNRSPFQKVAEWPYLEDEFERASCQLFATQGRDVWASSGGEYVDGVQTLRSDSSAAETVIRNLEDNPGGFLWESEDGILAVRLLRSRRNNQRFGLGMQLDLVAPADSTQRSQDTVHVPTNIRFGGRGEQLLWLIHSEVMRNRQSLISLPAPLVKQLIWGPEQCPRSWRRDVELLFQSLTRLRVDLLQLNRRGWQPRLGATSSLVDHVEFSWILGDLASECDHTCKFWGSSEPHHHIRVGIGHSFLGVLEACRSSEDRGIRIYDFKPKKSDRKRIEPSYPLINAMAGRRGITWSATDRSVLQGVIAEMTRSRSGEPILQVGNMTPNIDVPCPQLRGSEQYVAFNGNGQRGGHGYGIAGTKGTGWLYKTGISSSIRGQAEGAKRLFNSLDRLSSDLGLIAVAFSHSQRQWFSLSDLKSLVKRKAGRARLSDLLLRVYGPRSFNERLDTMFGSRRAAMSMPNVNRDLTQRLLATGITHNRIAQELGVSRAFISGILSGRRSWPAPRAVQARRLLEGIEAESLV